MKFAETTEAEPLANENQCVVQMPFGLLGFENVKRYVLQTDAQDAPFLWFQMTDEPKVAFLVLNPFLVFPDYQPDLSDDDVAFLGLTSPADALLFNIVTVRSQGQATINLKGPIVVNRQTMVGKQVIPSNASSYDVQHPLPVAG